MPSTNSTRARQTRKGNRVARTLKGGRPDGKTMQDIIVDRLVPVVTPECPPDQVHLTEHEAWQQGLITLTNIAILSDIPYAKWALWSREDPDFPKWRGREYKLGRAGVSRLYDARELRTWYHRASADGVL